MTDQAGGRSGAPRLPSNPNQHYAWHLMDCLDVEESDDKRALLIDAIIALAEIDPDVAQDWTAYR